MRPPQLSVLAAVVALAAVLGAATAAHADDSRLATIEVSGHTVTTVIDGVPAVGELTAVRRYGRSGRFAADRRLVAAAARTELASIVEARCPNAPAECRSKRLAIVVDIDDTLLDWYPEYAGHAFTLRPAVRQAAVRSCATPVIASVRSLVRDAQRAGVEVLLVSGRREPVRKVTTECLQRRGITAVGALVLRSESQDALPAAVYKQQAYERLLDEGWEPVLSIGDQQGDLVGGTDTPRFLLPNPLYVAG